MSLLILYSLNIVVFYLFVIISEKKIEKLKGEAMKGNFVVKSHQISSSLSVFTGDYIPENCETVFFPGCSLSGYNSNIVNKTFEYLSSKIDNIGLIVACCSKPSCDIKDNKRHTKIEGTLKEKLKDYGIKNVITACSNCFIMFKQYQGIKVISLWEVLDNIKEDDFNGIGEGIDLDIALHDPCPIRKEDIIHDSVRSILKASGYKYQEFDNCRSRTICCGASGMMMARNPVLAKALMTKRANSTKSSRIVSYCESCVQSMIVGGKESLHLLDLLFNEKVKRGDFKTQTSIPLLKHWVERRKTSLIPRKRR